MSKSSVLLISTFVGAFFGAIIGYFIFKNTNIVLPGLGIVVFGALFGTLLGLVAGAFIGLIVGIIAIIFARR